MHSLHRGSWALILCVTIFSLAGNPTANAARKYDVAIYGTTPAGIAAAVAAGSEGHAVLLIEPTSRIGGMTTNGLSHPDFRSFEALNGFYLELTQRVERYYRETYGADSQEVKDCFRGTHAEPKVNLLVFERMLADQPSIEVVRETRLVSAMVVEAGERTRITSLKLSGRDQATRVISARYYIDATYEGDLLAAAGVPYHVGREGKATYGESLAPDKEDNKLQGYNFRLTMTMEPDNRADVPKPEGYRREDFAAMLPLLGKPPINTVFCRSHGGIYKNQKPRLPRGKFDINDVSRTTIRLSMPDINNAWPEGDEEVRKRLFAEHVRYNVGMLYFLQHDPAVPEAFQQEALLWGFCKDEFVENDHLPVQLYVREGRRMMGRYIFTERDTDCAPNDPRAILHTDAIAMGDYGPNCHGTDHPGPRFGSHHTGEFYKRTAPYQIPYGVLTPKRCANLLVPVACSSSHVGFCALRLEPIWSSLGSAAGYAAHVALTSHAEKATPVQDVDVSRIQKQLHRNGMCTIYTSDVLPGHEDFAAVQWWGTHGGLHGLEPREGEPGTRGANLVGQYYEAFPQHAARLDQTLDEPTKQAWMKLAESLRIDTKELRGVSTRGEWIRSAYAHVLN